MRPITTTSNLLAALAVGASASIVAAAASCAAPQPEPTGSRTEKLLAPSPLLTAEASPETRTALGITEWRLYRGQNAYVLTGYDAQRAPVKGLSIGFVPGSPNNPSSASLRATVLDGS